MKNSVFRFLFGASILSLCLTFGSVHAQYYDPVASPVVQGSYTVTWVPDCGSLSWGYCAFTVLQERRSDSATWSNVSSGNGSMTFDAKSAGTYYYRIYAGAYDYSYNYMEVFSAEIMVVVSQLGVRDNLLDQLQYQYAVRQGDINSDGRADLYLARTAGGQPYNGTVERLLLRQDSGGNFTALVPTTAQASLASAWPASGIEPVLEDFNADGYVDVALTGVPEVIAGADDLFVYAPAQPGVAAPKGVRRFDSRMVRFVSNAMDYIADQDYFADNAPSYYFQHRYWVGYCDYIDYSPNGLDYGLYYYWSTYWYQQTCYYGYYYVSGVYQDYSGFSDEAVNLWTSDYRASSGYIDENVALDQVRTDIEDLIGVGIGGWPMEEVLGPVGQHQNPFVRAGIEIGRTILGQARGGRTRTQSQLIPPQRNRKADHIYITGHPLQFARARGHLALEYTDSLGGGIPVAGETLSAGPEVNSIISPGKLIAETDRPTDHPLFNFLIAEVEPQNVSDFVYWETYLKQRHRNYMNLPLSQKVPYALVPINGTGTHNSNSYISGLTYDNPANVRVDLPNGIGFLYPGWNQPVPDWLFR